MKKLLLVFASISLFLILYFTGLDNIWTYSTIMLTRFNGIPSPTWIVMKCSYNYGPLITIPIMTLLWFINSTFYFYFWRHVFFYKKDLDKSTEYIQKIQSKQKLSLRDKLLLKWLTSNLKWYYIVLLRFCPMPFSSSVMVCSSLKGISRINFLIGNFIAVFITTCYFAYAIDMIKMSEIPDVVKWILYIIHLC